MTKEAPETSPRARDALAEPRTPRDDVRVKGGATRCPFCHDEVAARGNRWVACRVCLARHHAACWRESRRCAACGSTERVAPPRLTPLGATLLVVAIAVVLTSVVVPVLQHAQALADGAALTRALAPLARTEPGSQQLRLLSGWGRTPHRWKDLPVGSFIEVEQTWVDSGSPPTIERLTLVAKTREGAQLQEQTVSPRAGEPLVHSIDFGAAWTKYEVDLSRGCGVDESLYVAAGALPCRALVYEENVPPPEGPGRMREEVWFASGTPEPVKCTLHLLDKGTTWSWTLRRFERGND